MNVPGAAGAVVRALDPARRHDLYDAAGAPFYHRMTDADPSEVREILAALRGVRGSVLELACGSGRVTFPLLAAGFEVTATDLSPTMIELLSARLRETPRLARRADRLTAEVADMAAFAFERRFDAIVLATTSITLLDAEQRAACLARVRDHLAPGGRFLVSTVDVDASEPVETVAPLAGIPGATLHEYIDPGAGRRWTSVVLADEAGTPEAIYCSSPALVPSGQLASELERAGLTVLARHQIAFAGGLEDRAHWLLECTR